jgi:hypothetical protein
MPLQERHSRLFSSHFLIIRAGAPIAIQRAGTLLVTTLLAPITDISPIVVPGKITTFCPIQQPLFTTTGAIRLNG